MKIKAVASLLLAIWPVLAWASPVAHLRSALETDDRYRQIQTGVNVAERELVVRKASLLPQLRGNTNYRVDDSSQGQRQDDRGNSRYSTTITATQELLNYRLTHAVTGAEQNLELARHRVTDLRQQILLATYRSYLATALAKQRITLLDRRREHLNEQLRFATLAFEFGKASRLDVINVEAQIAALKAERIAAEGDLVTARRNLTSLSGLSSAGIRKLVSQPSISDNRKDWLDKATNAPAVQIAATELLIQETAISQARGSILPSLSLQGSSDLAGGHGLFLQLSYPLYSSGGATAEIEGLELRKEALGAGYDQVLEDTRLAVRNAWHDLQLQDARSDALASSVAIATKRLELANASIELRSGVLSDALSAESDLAAAELELLQANHTQLEAWITLLASVGEFSLEKARELERLFG